MCCAATSHMIRSGSMFVTIPPEPAWPKVGRNGPFAARFGNWTIVTSASAVIDRRYNVRVGGPPLGRVIVDDPPAGLGSAEEEGEGTVGFVLRTNELPAAEDDRGVGA